MSSYFDLQEKNQAAFAAYYSDNKQKQKQNSKQNVTSIVATTAIAICCAVCKAAGKSSEVYSSHWPRDSQGNTCCPTLLSQTCGYCRLPGHTPKYCQVLAQNNKPAIITKQILPKPTTATASASRFKSGFELAFGNNDSSDDEDVKKTKETKKTKESFPLLTTTIIKAATLPIAPTLPTAPTAPTAPTVPTYASRLVASTTKPEAKTSPIPNSTTNFTSLRTLTSSTLSQAQRKELTKNPTTTTTTTTNSPTQSKAPNGNVTSNEQLPKKPIKSWADESDDEDDDSEVERNGIIWLEKCKAEDERMREFQHRAYLAYNAAHP